MPQTPETSVYDIDGNLATNGLWILTWDAENRLIGLDPAAGVPDAGKKWLRFSYDSQSRRISKTVTNLSGIVSSTRFVYDQWNLLADLNASNNAVVCCYIWGLDLGGTPQGAGGVGGLVAINESGNGSHFRSLMETERGRFLTCCTFDLTGRGVKATSCLGSETAGGIKPPKKLLAFLSRYC